MPRCEICGDEGATNKVDFHLDYPVPEWYECATCHQLIEESGEKEIDDVQKEEDD